MQPEQFYASAIVWALILFYLRISYSFFGCINRTKNLESTLYEQANQDHLTKLLNRRAFNKLIKLTQREWNHQQHIYCLIVVDIDHFKRINDTHGHGVGDQVIIKFAKLLKENVRANDVVARWVGEEFVILLSDTNAHDGFFSAENCAK